MTKSVDPDQLASTQFAKTGHIVFSKRRVNITFHRNSCIYADSVNPDQTPPSAASALGLHS